MTDPQADPDRRAWHRAQAAAGPDEEVAAELERSAGRAQARGGLAAAAAFLERSVALTADPARHAERTLAAAQASMQAGAFGKALELLATAEAGPLDEFQRARVDLLRGHVAFASGLGSDAPPLLLKAARRLEPFDLGARARDLPDRLARGAMRGHLAGATSSWRSAAPSGPSLRRRALRVPSTCCSTASRCWSPTDRAAATPTLQRAAKRYTDMPVEDVLRWGWLAAAASALVWDFEGLHAISARQVQLARDAGALAQLPIYLNRAGHSNRVDRRLRRRGRAHRGDRQRGGGDRQPHRALHRAEAPGAARKGSRGLRD